MPLRSRMVARDLREPHRASSPLELLFDLTFVAAVSQAAGRFAHAIESGHVGGSLAPFLMTFFAIWWAWMNFTWFASAYDTDDVPYRLMTFVQMAGVLVLAAGVPGAFDGDFTTVTIGYLVMRAGLVALWLRAAAAHPEGRATALRYAIGLFVVQVFWVARLALPDQGPMWVFFVFAALAAIGAGLETAVASSGHHVEAGTRLVAASVAVPIAVVLVMLWALHAPIRRMNTHPGLLVATAVLVLLTTFAAPDLGIPGTLLLMAALLALLLATTFARPAPRPAPPT
jgi:hypothetical protein